METLEDNNKFKCNVCGKLFSFQSNLLLHKQIHSAEWQYRCKICQEVFEYFRDLARHKKVHEGSTKYKCDVCDKWFTESDLTIHHQMHTNKLLHCDFCNKCFLKRAALTRHKKSHIELTESNGEANKQFKRNNSYLERKKTNKKLKN